LISSEDGKRLFVLCYADDDSHLKKQAKNLEYKLKLDIGLCDLESLEPCDSMYWPYKWIEKLDKSQVILDIYKTQDEIIDHQFNMYIEFAKANNYYDDQIEEMMQQERMQTKKLIKK